MSLLHLDKLFRRRKLSQISCGANYTALLTKRGNVYMCGSGEDGRLGTGDRIDRLIPTKILNVPSIFQVSCGGYHTAFLTKSGEVYMCGSGIYGELGFRTREDKLIPTRVINIPLISQVSCGVFHTAFLTKGGEVYMCGDGINGRLGTGNNEDSHVPTMLLNLPSISQVSCGDSHTAFLTREGEVYMCGDGRNGRLGTGDEENRLIPVKLTLTNLPAISQVSCGYSHTAFLTREGEVYMCGYGEHGRLGTGDEENRLVPTKLTLTNLPAISQVSCGYSYTGFLTKNGNVYMCGDGSDGQFGTGDRITGLIPTKLTSLLNLLPISEVSCGYTHTAFLTKRGMGYVCGDGRDGQLGTGDRENELSQGKVVYGSYHTAFLIKGENVCMCGDGGYGQLGTGNRENRLITTVLAYPSSVFKLVVDFLTQLS